jgi:hypothetical protein
MDTIEEKALNPCHIVVQAIPRRQLWSKENRILDQLIFRYRGVSLILAKTIELESCPLTPIIKGPDFLRFLLKPGLSLGHFATLLTLASFYAKDTATTRHYARLEVYLQLPAQTLSLKHLLKHLTSHNSWGEAVGRRLPRPPSLAPKALKASNTHNAQDKNPIPSTRTPKTRTPGTTKPGTTIQDQHTRTRTKNKISRQRFSNAHKRGSRNEDPGTRIQEQNPQ